MKSKRERLAHALTRSCAPELVLQARRLVRLPTLTVFTYHSIRDPSTQYPYDDMVCDAAPEDFDWQLRYIGDHFSVIRLEQLLGALAGDCLPPNPALLTFDDGYRDNYEMALPILRKHGMTAVFFVASQIIDRRQIFWWDRISYIVKRTACERLDLRYPALEIDTHDRSAAIRRLCDLVKDTRGLDLDRFLDELAEAADVEWSGSIEAQAADELVLTWTEVRALRDAGMEIQSHTRSHRVLTTLDSEELADELRGSRDDLERELGCEVRALAYPTRRPVGHVPEIAAAVRASGYDLAFAYSTGINYNWRSLNVNNVCRLSVERNESRNLFRAKLAVPLIRYGAEVANEFAAMRAAAWRLPHS